VRSIRELCVFARRTLPAIRLFSRLDLVSCRNLLIYLSNLSQQRVMQIFHYALRQRGSSAGAGGKHQQHSGFVRCG